MLRQSAEDGNDWRQVGNFNFGHILFSLSEFIKKNLKQNFQPLSSRVKEKSTKDCSKAG